MSMTADQRAHYNRVYTDQGYLDELARRPSIAESMKASPYPEQAVFRAANKAFLSDLKGVPEGLGDGYEAYRDAYAKERFGERGGGLMSDATFFNLMREDFETENTRSEAMRALENTLITNAFETAMTGESREMMQTLMDWRTEHEGLFPWEAEADLVSLYGEASKRFTDEFGELVPKAAEVWKILSKTTGREEGEVADEDYQALVEMLLESDPEERQQAYGLLAAYTELQGVEKGAWAKFGESLSRSFTGTGESVSRTVRERDLQTGINLLRGDKPVMVTQTGTVIDPEDERRFETQRHLTAEPVDDERRAELLAEKEKQLAAVGIERELSMIAQGVVDPIQAETWGPEGSIRRKIEQGLYDGTQSLAYTAMAGIPYAGVFLTGAAIYAHNYDQLRYENPDVDPDYLSAIAAVSAAPEALLERFQFRLLTGKLPMFSKVMERMGRRGAPLVQRIPAAVGLNITEQNFQEAAQDLTREAATEIGAALNEDMPGRDWDKVIDEYGKERIDTFFALLPMVLIGSGAITYREIKRGAAFTKWRDGLKMAGYSEETAERIADIENPNQRAAEIVNEFQNRKPEDIKAGARLAAEQSQGAREVQEDPNLPTLAEEVDTQGNATWVIRDEQGREAFRTPDADGALAAFSEINSVRSRRTREAVNAMIQFYKGRGREEGREVDFDVSQAPRSVADVLAENPASIDQLRDRMRIAGLEGTDPSEVFILGETTVEKLRDEVTRTVIKLHRGANPRTVVEESVEGFTRDALLNNRVTLDELRVWVEQYQDATGETLLTDTDQSVVEAVSTLGEAYFGGRVRERSLPEALAGFFKQLAVFFKDVFARAIRLEQAVAEGKVAADFETFLAESVGIPIDRQMEARRVRVQEEMLEGATFSISGQPEIGQPLNSQKGKIPKIPGKIVPVLLRMPKNRWVEHVTQWLDQMGTITDPDGQTVLLPNPEKGSLTRRARHLLGSFLKGDRFRRGDRVLLDDKARTVFAIPTTIQDYQIKAEDGKGGLAYIRRYEDGTLHMVLVEKATGKLRDHGLITQRALDTTEGAEGLAVQKVRVPPDPSPSSPAPGQAGADRDAAPRRPSADQRSITPTGRVQEQRRPEGREGQETFSLASAEEIARIDERFDKLLRSPDSRLAMLEESRRRLMRLMKDNRAEIAAMEFSRGAEQSELDAAGVRRAERHEINRTKLIQSIAELDALLSAFPPDIRGKVGGYTTLTRIGGGEKGLANFFLKRLDMIDRELERMLKKEYDAKLRKLFKLAEPKRKAGEKPRGKAGADIHALFDRLKEALGWTMEEADAHIAGLEVRIAGGEMTAEQEAHAMLEKALIPWVADWKNAEAERRAGAFANLENVFMRGYAEQKIRETKKRERRAAARSDLIADTGKIGTDVERQEKEMQDNGWRGTWKGWMLSLLNFEQIFKYSFGDNSSTAQEIADMERDAAFAKSDGINLKMASIEDLFSQLAGGALAGEKLRWRMVDKQKKRAFGLVDGKDDQPVIKAKVQTGTLRFSQLEGVAVTLMWRQEDGKRHMIGQLDENGNPVGKWHYDQKFVNQVERQLTPEARAVREFLADSYEAEYDALNKVYRELNGIDLPKHKFYSPITVTPMQAKAGQEIDPVTGVAFTAGSTTPGSLRSRGSATAPPKFRDALQTYISHTMQMEHWKAYSPFVSESRALFGNRDVTDAVKAKAGDQAARIISGWMDYAAQGGAREAAAHLEITQSLNRIMNRAASVALVGRASVLAIQSTQLGAALAEMPTGAYLKRIAGLLSGQMKWGEAFKSPYIQRRIEQMPPIVRRAVDGLRSEKPTALKHAVQKLGRLIGGADALFTAGTYAMVFDYQLQQAKASGLSEADARLQATREADRITDRVAQPTRPGTRSYFEVSSTNPAMRLVWAFASEARKNLGISAYALMNRPWSVAGRTLGYVALINGLMATIIRTAWRDMRDDDDDEWFDEKHWNPERLALMWLTEPLYGVPFIGETAESALFSAAGQWQPSGDLLSSIPRAVPAIKRIPDTLAGEQETGEVLRDIEGIISAMGLFNSNLAAAASLSHIVRDAHSIGENVLPEE